MNLLWYVLPETGSLLAKKPIRLPAEYGRILTSEPNNSSGTVDLNVESLPTKLVPSGACQQESPVRLARHARAYSSAPLPSIRVKPTEPKCRLVFGASCVMSGPCEQAREPRIIDSEQVPGNIRLLVSAL